MTDNDPQQLIYSEEPPSVPGWYWERDGLGNERILELPCFGGWPSPWHDLKARVLETLDERTADKMWEFPDYVWKKMWAGPIPKPALPL